MIVTHCSSDYLFWLEMYLGSIQKAAPGHPVTVFGSNLTEDDDKRIHSYGPVTVINHWVGPPKGMYSKTFFQCQISYVMRQAWNVLSIPKIIVTNADMLLRKPLDELYGLLDTYDLLLRFDEEHLKKKNPSQIQNGVIAFNCSNPVVLDFLEAYDAVLWGIKPHPQPYDDQKVLYNVWREFDGKLKVGALPLEYIDGDFTPAGVFWSPHKHGRFHNYQKFCKITGRPVLVKEPKWFI